MALPHVKGGGDTLGWIDLQSSHAVIIESEEMRLNTSRFHHFSLDDLEGEGEGGEEEEEEEEGSGMNLKDGR